jgi:MoaA/NifB/PqqE/SkfB family radical SAM enzyme
MHAEGEVGCFSVGGTDNGSAWRGQGQADFASLRQPLDRLAKVYVEPTNRCNLECRTCIRHGWDEPLGQVNDVTFARIRDGLRAFSPPPTVFFGGFGEPLAHQNIVGMVAQAKALGGPVELITNGTLLTRDVSERLIAAGLDLLWVSLDGATPESYTDVRLGAALPQVLANLAAFRDARGAGPNRNVPQIGIAFVMMKRNVADLPAVLRLGGRLGATRFMVSNVLPYTKAMCEEALYPRVLTRRLYSSSDSRLDLSALDGDQITYKSRRDVMRGGLRISLAGGDLAEARNRCPFVERGAMAIAWDGSVSPCLPLLHSHVSYLGGQDRLSRRYVVGQVAERDLRDLWTAPEYVAFRQRVRGFEFSPCTGCGGCNLSEANQEDCYDNPFPTCGGCLWAQGMIHCP